ncbi:MAG: META domain-containing protein [Chloroflexota bacterium]|nr:MAG: META domain-containing protein [Chloroflexota bacterium]
MEEQTPNEEMESQAPETGEESTEPAAPDGPEEQAPAAQESQGGSNTLVIVLAVALVLALAGILFLVLVYVVGGDSESGGEEVATLPPPGVTVEATVVPPTPEPGDPTATVTARAGVNVRTGPGVEYPVVGIAPFGAELEVVGVSADGTWWAINIPEVAGGVGWVSEEFVEVENGDDVLVLPAPPTPTPAATPTPTATPAPDIEFTASRTTINAGETATLAWSVENVTAVYLYPVGDHYANYPVTGQGTKDVQPYITTSYELLTFNPDNTTSAERIEITVVNGLTTGRWLLQSYVSSSGGLQSLLPGTEITARFGADGSLSGSGGCNSYSGRFTAYDQTLLISNLSSSQQLCATPEGIMEQEGQFLILLQQADEMAISAGQLTIFDAAGNRILVFING